MKLALRRSVVPAMNLRRRDLLKGGAGPAALAVLGGPAHAAAGEPTSDAELFAFSAPRDGALVFAVTFPVHRGVRQSPTLAVRLHAGQKSWNNASAKAPAFITGVAEESRAFVGHSMRMTEAWRD